MERLNLEEREQNVVYGEICRFLGQADESLKHKESVASDYDRGVANGKALAYQAAAMRLAEMAGLLESGSIGNVEEEIDWLRKKLEEV